MVTHDYLIHTTLDFGPHNVHRNMTTHNIVATLVLDRRQTLLDAFCNFHSNFTTYPHHQLINFYLPKPLVNISPCKSMCNMLLV
jgi:hypothetical protein